MPPTSDNWWSQLLFMHAFSVSLSSSVVRVGSPLSQSRGQLSYCSGYQEVRGQISQGNEWRDWFSITLWFHLPWLLRPPEVTLAMDPNIVLSSSWVWMLPLPLVVEWPRDNNLGLGLGCLYGLWWLKEQWTSEQNLTAGGPQTQTQPSAAAWPRGHHVIE